MTANALELKEEANRLFAQGKYVEAHAKYTEALGVASGKDTAVLYCNRAQTCLLLKRWDDARYDAADALVADPSYHKAWLRLGRAYDGMKDFGASGRAYSIGCHESKDNPPLMRALDAAVRESRQAFNDTPYALPPCDPPTDPARAALSRRLQQEGDALLDIVNTKPTDQISWRAAYAKYTLALAFDRSSAVLYFNRARLCVVREMWGEAIEDGKMAIHINEDYHKAYLLTGRAYLSEKKLLESFEILNEGLLRMRDKPKPWSPADEKLYKDIDQAKSDVENSLRRASGLHAHKTDAPWVLAAQHVEHVNLWVRNSWYTSAWPIDGAYKEFSSGVALLYQTRVHGNEEMAFGQFGPMFQRMARNLPPGGSLAGLAQMTGSETILPITNGLVSDMRVFHAPHDDLKQRIEQGMAIESRLSRTFKESEPRALMRAVKARLREQNGWDATATHPVAARKSMTITVRIWILRATLSWKFDEDYDRACSLFQAAVEFLELGRQEWANVSREFRGAILERTFLLVVLRACLECCVERYAMRARIEISNAPTLLETIREIASKILVEVGNIPQAEKNPLQRKVEPNVITFIVYPEAVAHSAIAFYFKSKAEESSSSARQDLLLKSAESFQKAIALYPRDEEMRCEALYQLIDVMFKTAQPLAKTLPLCDSLADSIGPARGIWRASALAAIGAFGRWESLVTFAKAARRGIMQKKFKMQDPVTPDSIDASTIVNEPDSGQQCTVQ